MSSRDWTTGEDGRFFQLFGPDFAEVDDFGVYVIWQTGNPGHVVKVGQGRIRYCLGKCRKDPVILGLEPDCLFVTWIGILYHERDALEHYLIEWFSPSILGPYQRRAVA